MIIYCYIDNVIRSDVDIGVFVNIYVLMSNQKFWFFRTLYILMKVTTNNEWNTGWTYKTNVASNKFPDDGSLVTKHVGFGT